MTSSKNIPSSSWTKCGDTIGAIARWRCTRSSFHREHDELHNRNFVDKALQSKQQFSSRISRKAMSFSQLSPDHDDLYKIRVLKATEIRKFSISSLFRVGFIGVAIYLRWFLIRVAYLTKFHQILRSRAEKLCELTSWLLELTSIWNESPLRIIRIENLL